MFAVTRTVGDPGIPGIQESRFASVLNSSGRNPTAPSDGCGGAGCGLSRHGVICGIADLAARGRRGQPGGPIEIGQRMGKCLSKLAI